jgi:hypothetical protein
MATLQAKLQTGIFGYSPLASLLGLRGDGNPAVYEAQLAQGSTFPAIVVLQVSNPKVYSTARRLETSWYRMQFTIWATSGESSRAVLAALAAFLDQFDAIGIPGLSQYPCFIQNTREAMYVQTQPPQYQQVCDAMIFNNDSI